MKAYKIDFGALGELMIRFIEKIVAKSKINNLYIDLNEREYSIYMSLQNKRIGLNDAIAFYDDLHYDAEGEYKALARSYDFEKLGLEKNASDVVKAIEFIDYRKNSISQQKEF